MATIGYDSQVGQGAATFQSTDTHRLMDGFGTYTPSSAETVTEVGIQKRTIDSVNIEIGVYRTDTKALIGSAVVNSSASVDRVVTATSFSLSAGVTYAVGFRFIGSTTAQISYLSSASHESALTGASALANPFVTTVSDSTKFGIFATSLVPTSIDTIDDPIKVGTPINITTSGLGTLTTASTVGGDAVTAVNAPSGDGTITYSFTNGVLGPLMGTVSVVASDGTNTATATGKTLQTINGYTSRILAGLDRSATSLGSDPAINDGDEIHAPNLGGGTLAINGLFTSVPFGTYSGFWKRDVVDGKMYTFTVIISSSGVSILKSKTYNIGIGISTTF